MRSHFDLGVVVSCLASFPHFRVIELRIRRFSTANNFFLKYNRKEEIESPDGLVTFTPASPRDLPPMSTDGPSRLVLFGSATPSHFEFGRMNPQTAKSLIIYTYHWDFRFECRANLS